MLSLACPSILAVPSQEVTMLLFLLLQIRANLPPGVDGWGVSLRGMMSMVVGFGLVIVAIFYYLNRTVVPRVSAAGTRHAFQLSGLVS